LSSNGKLYVSTGNPSLSNFSIMANNVVIGSRGLISTVLPPSNPLHSVANPNLGLQIRASNTINNAGTILSAGNLSIASGSGNITNSGLVSSTQGSITLLSANNSTNLNINGWGGTFYAGNGAINVNETAYGGSGNITINGGNFLSQALNLNCGTGN